MSAQAVPTVQPVYTDGRAQVWGFLRMKKRHHQGYPYWVITIDGTITRHAFACDADKLHTEGLIVLKDLSILAIMKEQRRC